MLKLWSDAVLLSFETQQVIGLRMLRIAKGGSRAHAEARRMVSEKLAASLDAAATVLRGGSGQKVLGQVRGRVRRNARRLARRRAR
jgi:hypothetical protein